jgi:hypothetical protein
MSSNGMMLIPSFMKIHQLAQKLSGQTHGHDIISQSFLTKKENSQKQMLIFIFY